MCVYVCERTCAGVFVWRSEDNLGPVPSFHSVGLDIKLRLEGLTASIFSCLHFLNVDLFICAWRSGSVPVRGQKTARDSVLHFPVLVRVAQVSSCTVRVSLPRVSLASASHLSTGTLGGSHHHTRLVQGVWESDSRIQVCTASAFVC